MPNNGETAERPRVEPEIIPPDHSDARSAWRTPPFAEAGGTQRIYLRRLSPFGGILLLAAIVVIALIALLAFLGALLLWIPLLALILVVTAISGLWRARRS